MKYLRQTIRNIILENCHKVNDKIKSGIEAMEFKGFFIEVLRADEDVIHLQLSRRRGRHVFEAGFIKLAKVIYYNEEDRDKDIAWRKQHRPGWTFCNDSYIVHHSLIHKLYQDRLKGEGVGAVLYDVALELAGKKGISPDRYSISDDSLKMYNHFYRNPDKYERKYLDKMGETEPTEDDCPGDSALEHPYEEIPPYELSGSPLGYTYIKKDMSQSTIKCLKERGLIFGNLNFQA